MTELLNFSWVIAGELAGMGRPRTEAELHALHAVGVRAVISLTEEPLPTAWLAAAGLASLHLPVADFTAPTLTQIAEAIVALDEYRAAGIPVVIHCAGGRGRTGTMLACALVAQGQDATTALATVRALRPGSVETRAQKAVITAYATARGTEPHPTTKATRER